MPEPQALIVPAQLPVLGPAVQPDVFSAPPANLLLRPLKKTSPNSMPPDMVADRQGVHMAAPEGVIRPQLGIFPLDAKGAGDTPVHL